MNLLFLRGKQISRVYCLLGRVCITRCKTLSDHDELEPPSFHLNIDKMEKMERSGRKKWVISGPTGPTWRTGRVPNNSQYPKTAPLEIKIQARAIVVTNNTPHRASDRSRQRSLISAPSLAGGPTRFSLGVYGTTWDSEFIP